MAGNGNRPAKVKLNLADLKAFDRNTLKKTETTVTNTDGSKMVEGIGPDGKPYRKQSESDTYSPGFVIDIAEDLHVAVVLPGLIMGSQDVAHSLETLQAHKVTHILNVACGVENLYPKHFKYQTQEFRDHPEFPIFHGFENAIKFIENALNSSGCVLVHCNAGISRSSAIVMAYLIKTKGMCVNDSFSYLRSKRPPVCPNPGFMIQLQSYYESLYGQAKA